MRYMPGVLPAGLDPRILLVVAVYCGLSPRGSSIFSLLFASPRTPGREKRRRVRKRGEPAHYSDRQTTRPLDPFFCSSSGDDLHCTAVSMHWVRIRGEVMVCGRRVTALSNRATSRSFPFPRRSLFDLTKLLLTGSFLKSLTGLCKACRSLGVRKTPHPLASAD